MTAHRLTVGYIGNFEPVHSTENHVARALEHEGHTVLRLQENDLATWKALDADEPLPVDFVLWTRTWHPPTYGLPVVEQERIIRSQPHPTVGFHLDRWWGLEREHQVADEPFFRCDLMVTADGGHDAEWAAAGVNHLWMPPAIVGSECFYDMRRPRPEFRHDVVFVGSHARYHKEWPYRQQVVSWMVRTYGRKAGVYPNGRRAIRGQELTDLYLNAKVVLGDSCLAGNAHHYWSDRIPETLGRGGFLVHPDVEGLAEHFTPGEHLVTYPIGDFAALRATIDHYVRHDDERLAIARAGREHVIARHTYEKRMAALVDHLYATGMLLRLRDRAGTVNLHDDEGTTAVMHLRDGKYDGVAAGEVWEEGVYRLDSHDVKGRTVVDIGANVGAFSLWAAAAGAAKVIAYEPHPQIAEALEANLALNPDLADRIRVVKRAIGPPGAAHAFAVLGLDGYEGGSYVHDYNEVAGAGVEVPAWDLTTVLIAAGDGLVVKVDCEGCEFEIFDGIDGGHLRRIDCLVMEFHGPDMENSAHVVGGPGPFGALVAMLAEEGHVETLGRPSKGGMLFWTRYGA